MYVENICGKGQCPAAARKPYKVPNKAFSVEIATWWLEELERYYMLN
jgi:hypothetical protein